MKKVSLEQYNKKRNSFKLSFSKIREEIKQEPSKGIKNRDNKKTILLYQIAKKRKNKLFIKTGIGIEDIIIDRLNRYKHWKVYSDKEWIIGMIILNYDEIEWDYIYEKAKKERVIEELENFKQEAEEYDIE